MLEQPISTTQWTRMRFDQIATQINDRVDNPAEAGVDRYVGLEHLDPGSLRIRRWGEPTDVESTKLRFQPGDIIFGKRRVYQRKVSVADFEGICSAHAMVLRAKPSAVLSEFLPFFMQSDLFMERALRISVGSLSPTINWKALAAEEFLLPPIQEQARIVEAVYAVADYEESLDIALEALDDAEESMLENFLFNDGLPGGGKIESLFSRLQPGIELARISDVAEVVYGISAAVSDNLSPDIGWPILTGANIHLEGRLSLKKIVYHPAPKNPNFILEKGDVLLNWRSGSAEHVGKAAIFDLDGNWTYASFILRVRPYNNLNNRFLWRVLNFMRKRKLFGAATSQQINFKMNAAYFRDVFIPVPSKRVQDEMVEKLMVMWKSRQEIINRRNSVTSFRNSIVQGQSSDDLH